MLFDRTKDLIEGGGKLLRAEAELATERIRRAIAGSAALLGLVAIGLTGLSLVVAGVTVLLAERLGVAGSLLTVGGVICAITLVAGLVVRSRMRVDAKTELADSGSEPLAATVDMREPLLPGDQSDGPSHRIADAKEQLRDAADPDEASDTRAADGDQGDLKSMVADAFAKDPALVGSAAFLALSILGPGRAIRLIGRGAAAAGVISSVVESLKESEPRSGESQTR